MFSRLAVFSVAISLASCFSNTAYPSKDRIATIFSSLTGDSPSYATFFSHVSPTVNWTIEGTHPAAGQYNNRTVLEASFTRIAATASPQHPLTATVINIIGGGDEEWSVEELQIYGICNNGLVFDNRYAWATRWGAKSGQIVEARAYLDSALVSAALQENEIGTLFTYSDPRNTILSYVDLSAQAVTGATGLSRQVPADEC